MDVTQKDVSKINCLDLSKKNLCKFPDYILLYQNLRMLCLDCNDLTVLPDSMFLTLHRLTWLDVRNNKLTALSGKIGKCQHLETLLIQDNDIQKLPMELGLIENLKTLQLSGNPIVYPSPQILELGLCGIIQFLKGEYDTMGKSEKTIKKVRKSKTTTTDGASVSKKFKRVVKKRKLAKKKVDETEASENVTTTNSEITINREDSNNSTDLSSFHEGTEQDRGDNAISTPVQKTTRKVKKCTKMKTSINKTHALPKRNSDRYLARTNLKRSLLRAKERSLKDLWTHRLRVLLERQAAILQRRQTIEALKNWRSQVDKFHTLSNTEELQPPFDLDMEFLKIPTRSEYQTQLTTPLAVKKSRQNIKPKFKNDFSTKIDEIISSIKVLDRLNNSAMLTPTQEQKLLESEIKKLNDIQKALTALKFENDQELVI